MEEPQDNVLVAHVAKAIYESWCNAIVLDALGMFTDPPKWEDLGPSEKRAARRDAIAAIAAVNDYWTRIADKQFDENAKTTPG